MDLSYSPEELVFRDQVRSWLEANLPRDIRDKVVGYHGLSKEDIVRWHRILAAQGWSVPHWPVEWGGTGWNITQRYLYDEQFGLAGAPLGVLVMMAALPVGANALIFAQRYDTLLAETTAAIVLSTFAFALTAPLWLALLARLGHLAPG